jgi:hypothetical protein
MLQNTQMVSHHKKKTVVTAKLSADAKPTSAKLRGERRRVPPLISCENVMSFTLENKEDAPVMSSAAAAGKGSTRQTGAGARALHKGLPPPVALTTTRGTSAPNCGFCLVPPIPRFHFPFPTHIYIH